MCFLCLYQPHNPFASRAAKLHSCDQAVVLFVSRWRGNFLHFSVIRPSDDYICHLVNAYEHKKISNFPTHSPGLTNNMTLSHRSHPLLFQKHTRSERYFTESLFQPGRSKPEQTVRSCLVIHITPLRSHEHPVLQDRWLLGQLIPTLITLRLFFLTTSIQHAQASCLFGSAYLTGFCTPQKGKPVGG